MKLAFVFPGQGSQTVGMMDSFADNAVVQTALKSANEALGEDLAGMIHSGPAESLNLTVNTQPAMLACSVAIGLYFILRPYFGIETLSWVYILGAAHFAVMGFVKYNATTAEQLAWAWINRSF